MGTRPGPYGTGIIMEGFFTKKETQSDSRPDGRSYSCASCGLYQNKIHPRMAAFGNFKKGILNIGEAPGRQDDKVGRQWQSRMGKGLQQAFNPQGIDVFEDCLNINAVNCRPVNDKGDQRPPTAYEIACCRKRVLRIIKHHKPKVILLHGHSALQSIIGHRWKKKLGKFDKWRGWTIPDRDFNTWICPVFHPSYVEKMDSQECGTVWQQDLTKAFSMLKEPLPDFPNEEKQVVLVTNRDAVTSTLKKLNMGALNGPQLMAFDIETTGLKPYDKKNHRIVCTSFCDNPNLVYVVPELRRKDHKKALKELLENPKIGKIAANMKFEDTWENVMNGITVQNWTWDTMQAGHILDSRRGITSLKFQTYINFGVVDYDSEISSYLEGDPKNANSVNKILNLTSTPEGLKKIMTYCGMDSLFEYRLAIQQMEQMNVRM